MRDTEEQLCRLEMLIGHLSDMLSPAKALVRELRLQSNASVTTRGKLDHLNDLVGSLWEHFQTIEQEVKTIKALGEDAAPYDQAREALLIKRLAKFEPAEALKLLKNQGAEQQ
jgi:hypothetical protein